MQPDLPLSVLLAPLVIALMAVAVMNLVWGRDASPTGAGPAPAVPPRKPRARELQEPRLTLTPARYVGGHPDRASETPTPLVALDDEGLRVAPGPRREPAFSIAWRDIEAIDVLDGKRMRLAAGSVRGLAAEAIPEDREVAQYLRIRHMDPRGYWQHSVFELDAEHAEAQVEAIREGHRAHREAAGKDEGPPEG